MRHPGHRSRKSTQLKHYTGIVIPYSALYFMQRDLSPGFMNRTFSTEKPSSVACNLPLHRLSSVTTLLLYNKHCFFSSFLIKIISKFFYNLKRNFNFIFVYFAQHFFAPNFIPKKLLVRLSSYIIYNI